MNRARLAFSPNDEALGLADRLYSQGMAQPMVWLSGQLPYAQCVEVFEPIGQCRIGASSVWRRVQLGAAATDHAQVKGVSMEGGMVNIRGEGWKELKVGAV